MDRPRRRRWASRLAALVLSTLVAASGGCANTQTASPAELGSPSAPSATARATAVVPVTPRVSVEPEATLDPALPISGWTNTATFGDSGGWEVAHSIARGANNLVALGTRWEPINDLGFGQARQRIWVSPDGGSWAEVEPGPGFEGVTLVDVVATPDGGFAAFGSRAGAEEPSGRLSAVVWRSPNGRAWEEVESGLSEHLSIGKVVAGSMGYLLLGPQTGSTDPSLWFSHDALAWEEVQHYSQGGGYVKLDDIGAGDEGFVAFGTRARAIGEDWERFAVVSGDGRTWIESSEPFGQEDQDSQPNAAVAPLSADWIAAVPGVASSAGIWFSANGLDWERLESTETGNGVIHESNGRLVRSPDADSPYGPAGVWISVDGRSWAPLDLGGEASIGGVAMGPLGMVLVGSMSLGVSEARAAFWLRLED